MSFKRSINVEWDYTKQEDFISDRGTEVVHEMGIACTCRPTASFNTAHSPKVYCPICGGYGFIYRNPRRVEGLLVGITQSRMLVMSGYAIPGDCLFSPHLKLDPAIGDFDRITFTHPQPLNEGQIIVRGEGTKGDDRSYPLGLQTNEDRLFYQAAKALHCEDEFGKVYKEGVDFELKGRVICWDDSSIPINTRYVLKYEGYLEWIAFVGPFERRDRAEDLGQKVLLRKRHVAVTTQHNLKLTAEDKAKLGLDENAINNLEGILV